MQTRAVPTQCGKCGGAIWDNRGPTKKNPKAPDFKCKDKSCDWVAWPPSPKDPFVWADAVPVAKATETTTAATGGQVSPMQSIHTDCAEYVEVAVSLALNLNKAIEELRNADDQPAAELLAQLGNEFQAATATVYIQRKKGGR